MKTGIGFYSSDRARLKLICEKLGITALDVAARECTTPPPPTWHGRPCRRGFVQRDTVPQTYFWGLQRD